MDNISYNDKNGEVRKRILNNFKNDGYVQKLKKNEISKEEIIEIMLKRLEEVNFLIHI
jgi:ribosomal protein S8